MPTSARIEPLGKGETNEKDNCASSGGSIAADRLRRPFLYMILDTSTNTPIFIGAQMDMA